MAGIKGLQWSFSLQIHVHLLLLCHLPGFFEFQFSLLQLYRKEQKLDHRESQAVKLCNVLCGSVRIWR